MASDPVNELLQFASDGNANVEGQNAYAALSWLKTGFQSGRVSSAIMNKILRQGTTAAAMLGAFIVEQLAEDVVDNGDLDTLLDQFIRALEKNIYNKSKYSFDSYNKQSRSRAYYKKITSFPYRHENYDEAVSKLGSYGPQTFCIDEENDQIFIISGNGHTTVFEFTTQKYQYSIKFPLKYVSESAVIIKENDKRYIYLRGDSEFDRYDITELTQYKEFSAEKVADIRTQRLFDYSNGQWIMEVEGVLPISRFKNRGQLSIFDKNFNYLQEVYTPTAQVGIIEGVPDTGGITKAQGFAVANGRMYFSMGGFYRKPDQDKPRYGAYGIREFNMDGTLVGDYILDPERTIEKLNDLGFPGNKIENEGCTVTESGQLYSLLMAESGANSTSDQEAGGIYVVEEFSNDFDAVDFSDCATITSTIPDIYSMQYGIWPQAYSGVRNPIDNSEMKSWNDILDFMESAGLSEFHYYSSSIPAMKDLNGDSVDKGNLINFKTTNFYNWIIEITNSGGCRSFFVDNETRKQILVSSWGIGERINPGDDLNSYHVTGKYRIVSGSDGSDISNTPTNAERSSAILEVMQSDNWSNSENSYYLCIQRYTVRNVSGIPRIYIRSSEDTSDNTNWSEWCEVYHSGIVTADAQGNLRLKS